MAYELEGTLKVVLDLMKFASGFTKREFVVTVGDDRYPQDIKLEFVKDKVALLDRYAPGQRVKVGFDLRGGEHNGRYYVNLQAWRIHPADEAGPSTSSDSGGSSSGDRPPRDRDNAPPRQDRRDRGGDRGDRDRDRDRGGRDREDRRGSRNFGGRRGEDDDIDF